MASILKQRLMNRPVSQPRSPKEEVFEKIGYEDIQKLKSTDWIKQKPKQQKPSQFWPTVKTKIQTLSERWLVLAGVTGGIVFVTVFLSLLYQSDFLRQEAQSQLVQTQSVLEGHQKLMGTMAIKIKSQKKEIEVLHDEMVKAQQRVVYFDRVRQDAQKMTVQIKSFYEKQISNLKKSMIIEEARRGNLEAQVKSLQALLNLQKEKEKEKKKKEDLAAKQKTNIVTVDRENQFVIASMGSLNGVRQGMRMRLTLKDLEPVTGRVERVYPSYCAVVFNDAEVFQQIQVGDELTLKEDPTPSA